MKIKKIIVLFLAILCFTLSSVWVISNQSTNNLVAMAYNASGAKFVTCNINSYGILKNKSKLTIEKLLEIQKDICISLNLTNYDINNQENNVSDTTRQAIINISDELGRIFNIKVECYRVDEKNYTNYVYIDTILDSNIDNLDRTYNTVKNCYKLFKIKPIINTCAVGSFDGKLDDGIASIVKEKINNTTKVKVVENVNYLNSQSITAYKSNSSKYILSNGQKINLNYALRYNKLENRTYIYIASPIINIEY